MMYEVKDVGIDTNTFYDIPYTIDSAQDIRGKYSVNPLKNKAVIINDISTAQELFLPWFVGQPDRAYIAHVDLAKGQTWKGGDAAAVAFGHSEPMRVFLDIKMKKYLEEKMGIEDVEEIEGMLRPGVVMDFSCQFTCKPEHGELDIAEVRKLLIWLKIARGFDFYKIYYDGWQSLESIQQFNKYGIDAEWFSVDKNPQCYHTEKDLINMGIYKTYPNRVWAREKKEIMEVKGKIDHPEHSKDRLEQDDVAQGSKDLSDCTASVAYHIMEEIAESSGPVF